MGEMDNEIEMKNGIDNKGYDANLEEGDYKEKRTSEQVVKDSIELDSKPPKGETEERAQWGRGLEFLMSCVAASVGLGNMWRFPIVAYENGGGAFLIPYLIVLVLIGRPLYYMEMAIGQFTSRGNVKAFTALAAPLAGNGYGQLVGTFSVISYYSSLIGLAIFYFVNSFTSELPWSTCRDYWVPANNDSCIDATMTADDLNGTEGVSSSELYFTQEVLKEISNIEDGIGTPDWKLTLCLLAVWIITFAIIFKGVKSSGKAAYFLAIFPYVIMICLLIRAVTLEGSGEGMMYFIEPKWEVLGTAKVWYAAVSQCFFSLSVGVGPIIMYSSYNGFDHNIYRDAMIVSVLDTVASLLAGCTIFAILGNLAFQLNKKVTDVIETGSTGLAFISYPDAISKFEEVPWLFALLFFFMLFILGQGSLMALQSVINTAIKDQFPKLKVWHIAGVTSVIGFLVGLMYVTPGGQHLLQLVDHFGGTFAVYVTIIIEVCSITWFYGLENFCLDMEFMLKRKVGIYWRITWGVITPVGLIVIFLYFLATWEKLKYGDVYLPDGVLAAGWCILVVASIQMPIWTAYYLHKNKDLGMKKALCTSYRTDNWGPKNLQLYSEWKAFKEEKLALTKSGQESWGRRMLRVVLGIKLR